MCGIAGVITRELSTDRASSVVARMTRAMAHRGPDGEGTHTIAVDGLVVALGHRRLSIIDLSDEAAQPFRVPAVDAAMVFNGEIYNYKSLISRELLAMTDVAARSDVAVLAALVAQRWTDALPLLSGIFAFAAWDGRQRKLMLARDHIGVKPLYWATVGRTILFASEVRAILASEMVSRVLDRSALAAHLQFGAPIEPETLVDAVRTLAPGSVIEIDADLRVRERAWWTLREHVADSVVGRDAPSVREQLERAISAQMVSDVPVGVFLSGGVDSTAVATLATRAGFRPRAVSLFFEGSSLSEESAVRATARRLELDVHAVQLTGPDVIAALPGWLDAQDQPSIDGLNMFLVSRAAHEAGLKVVLSGVGGDEVFGGYRGFASARRAVSLASRARWLRTVARGVGALYARPHARASRALDLFAGTIPPYHVSRALRGTAAVHALLHDRMREDTLTGVARAECIAIGTDPSQVRQLAMLEMGFYLRNVLLRDADQMGMAHSLEVRVPLLDPELAACAISALGRNFPPPGISKPLLVDAVDDASLHNIARGAKHGFTIPLAEWLRAPVGVRALRDLVPDGGATDMFARGAIDQSIRGFVAGRESIYATLSIIVAARWMSHHGVHA